MIYSAEHIKDIEKYAGLNFSQKEVAKVLQFNEFEFIQDYSEESTGVRSAFERGLLKAKADQRAMAQKSPRFLAEHAAREKDIDFNKFINSLYNFDTDSSFKRLSKFSEEQINAYRKTGESDDIPTEVQRYIDQLERAYEFYPRTGGNVNRTAKKLCDEFDDLKFDTAKKVVYDSINFFHVDMGARTEAWEKYFANEEWARLKLMAIKQGDTKLAFDISKMQFEVLTRKDDSMPDSVYEMKEQLVSPDVNHERLGLKKHNLRELWTKSNSFIEGLAISDAEKDSLKAEVAKETGYFTEYEELNGK